MCGTTRGRTTTGWQRAAQELKRQKLVARVRHQREPLGAGQRASRRCAPGSSMRCRSSTTSSTRIPRTSCSPPAASSTSRSSRACRSTKAASPARCRKTAAGPKATGGTSISRPANLAETLARVERLEPADSRRHGPARTGAAIHSGAARRVDGDPGHAQGRGTSSGISPSATAATAAALRSAPRHRWDRTLHP